MPVIIINRLYSKSIQGLSTTPHKYVITPGTVYFFNAMKMGNKNPGTNSGRTSVGFKIVTWHIVRSTHIAWRHSIATIILTTERCSLKNT